MKCGVPCDDDPEVLCNFAAGHSHIVYDGNDYEHGNPAAGVYWNPLLMLAGPTDGRDRHLGNQAYVAGYLAGRSPERQTRSEAHAAEPDRAQELRDWWKAQAAEEIQDMAAKAAAYGSNSLAAMGRLMKPDATDPQALELGCFVYAYGKMQRWVDATQRGEQPSLDTIHDIKIYAGMAERIRETGTWP